MGYFQNESGNLQDEPRTPYYARKKIYKKSWDMSKVHKKQFGGALTSQIWDNQSIKINNHRL